MVSSVAAGLHTLGLSAGSRLPRNLIRCTLTSGAELAGSLAWCSSVGRPQEIHMSLRAQIRCPSSLKGSAPRRRPTQRKPTRAHSTAPQPPRLTPMRALSVFHLHGHIHLTRAMLKYQLTGQGYHPFWNRFLLPKHKMLPDVSRRLLV